MSVVYEIREYVEGELSPFSGWFNGLDAMDAARVDRYVRRMKREGPRLNIQHLEVMDMISTNDPDAESSSSSP